MGEPRAHDHHGAGEPEEKAKGAPRSHHLAENQDREKCGEERRGEAERRPLGQRDQAKRVERREKGKDLERTAERVQADAPGP